MAGAPGRQAPETASCLEPGRLQKPIGLLAPDHGAAFVSMKPRDVGLITPGDNHKTTYDARVPTFGQPARRNDDCRRRQRAFSYPALDKPANVRLEEFRGHEARIVHPQCDRTMTRVEPEGAASRGRLILFGRMAGHLATRPVASASRLLLARVVSGVHVGKTARADAVELNDRVLAGPGEMLHPLGHVQESAGLDRLPLALVDRVADTDVERAGEDRYVLIVGVRVGRDLEARGELQADDVAALLARVSPTRTDC